MTILADSQIIELCTIPKFVVTRRISASLPPLSSDHPLALEEESFSYATEEELLNELDSIKRFGGKNLLISYRELTDDEKNNYPLMISPFVPNQVRYDDDGKKIISYGLGSYGYDVTISDEFKIFSNINSTIIDPLNFNDETYVDFRGDVCILPPNSYALCRTREYFILPNDITPICLSKSTYARAGCVVTATVAEAGWEGELVIELSNSTSLPLKIYANQGMAQLLFFKGDVPCNVSYADRNGKYMHQKGITLPKG